VTESISADEDEMVAVPTLKIRFRDIIIDTTVCCPICEHHAPLHCVMCHLVYT
jgi:hypothetical protein